MTFRYFDVQLYWSVVLLLCCSKGVEWTGVVSQHSQNKCTHHIPCQTLPFQTMEPRHEARGSIALGDTIRNSIIISRKRKIES